MVNKNRLFYGSCLALITTAFSFSIRAGILPQLGQEFGLSAEQLGFINSMWLDFGLMLLLGVGNGYITIILFTWIQTRVPKTMLGRIMSLLTLSSIGLLPISQALSGAVSTWSLTWLFVCAGCSILLMAGWTAVQPGLVTFSQSLVGSN